MLALTPSDILPDKSISVTKNFAVLHGQHIILPPKPPKGKRKVSISDFLYDDIQAYISSIYGIQLGDRIFYFTKSASEKEVKRVAQKAGLPEIRLHDLRHSHVSLLVNMGVGISEISERLGHESVKTTMDTYAHLQPEKKTQLAANLNKLRRPDAPEETEENP